MHSLLSKAGLPVIGIFSELSADERAALMSGLETQPLKRGDVLVRQGEAADALYIVISGRFSVTLDGRREPLTEIGPEQPIGEIAFLTGGTRTATVTAMRDSLVLRLGRAEFDSIAAKCPGIWRTLTASLAQRLAATTSISQPSAPDPRPRTIAVIRAGGAHIPERFLDQLNAVFSASPTL
jgi:NTE family protein